jgi:hypothetical protein
VLERPERLATLGNAWKAWNLGTWLEELGFAENPFFLEPVPADERVIAKGFIDRDRERDFVRDFAQLKEGKLLIFGSIGEGKSSILNLLQSDAEKIGKLVLRINLLETETPETFIESLLTELHKNASAIPKENREKLDKSLDELRISAKTEKRGSKTASSIEGKLGAVIAHIKGQISGEKINEKEIEYYVPPRIRRLEGIVEQVLPAIIESTTPVLLCENLEKLPNELFEKWVKHTVNLLPKHVLLAATANICDLDPSTLKMCYDSFSVTLQMEKINEAAKLKEFVQGRMANYSNKTRPLIRFDDGTITALLDRSDGNLRECFRYCYSALQKFKRDIDKDMIENAMADVDAPRFQVLNETDRELLSLLSSGEQMTLDEILNDFTGEGGRDAVRKRLDGLAVSGLLKKTLVKSGRTHKVTYAVRKTVGEIWTKYFSS